MPSAPPLAIAATMIVACETEDGSDPRAVIEKAKESCMVSNSLRKGIPVAIEPAA